MRINFRGTALPLNEDGISETLDRLGINAAELWAVLDVETLGCGFIADRRPIILFERHIFSRETNHAFDSTHPDISNRKAGGYGAGGANQYDRLERAIELDAHAALRSASWGIGQLMGFNAEISGYDNVDTLVDSMIKSEGAQLIGMANEIAHNNLNRALRTHDWVSFARGYNGQNYYRNRYDLRLAAAYQKYLTGPLPDLAVRVVQMYLTFLGEYHPGPIDGVLGRFTYSAMNEFQKRFGLPVKDDIDDRLISTLKEEVSKLPM